MNAPFPADTTLQIARCLAALAGLFAFATLVGYAFGVPQLITVRSGLKGMSPLTAVAIVALAGALQAVASARRVLVLCMAGLAAACALAALGSHALTGADRLSAAVAASVFGLPAGQTGFVAVATAVCILLLAAAAGWRRERVALADRCAGLSMLISGTALLGYAYNVGDLYAIPIFNTMAIHTAASLFALSLAALLVVPETGWIAVAVSPAQGGALTRQLLAFVMLPPLVGAVLVRATTDARLGSGASMAMMVIVTIVPLLALILRNGRARTL